MNNRRRSFTILLSLLLSLAAAPARAQKENSEEPADRQLEGTWLGPVTIAGETTPYQVLFTFNGEGKTGTLISSNSIALTGGTFACLPDQGAWKKERDHTYVATSIGFCFDLTTTPPGEPSGTLKFRDALTLSKDGVLHVTQFARIFDPQGNLIVDNIIVEGDLRRVQAEGPPETSGLATPLSIIKRLHH